MQFVSSPTHASTDLGLRNPPPAIPRVADRFSWPICCAAMIVSLLPLLLPYFRDLGQRPAYSLYPLLIVAAVALGVSRLRDVPADQVRPGRWIIAGTLLTLGLLTLVIGTATYVRWLAAPAALLTLAGLVWRGGGPVLGRALLPVGVLLLTIVPPPHAAKPY